MNDSELTLLGLKHHQNGQYDRAKHYYQQALKKNQRNADSWHLLGVVSLQKGDYQNAEANILRAIRISPNEVEYHNNLGLVYRGKGEFQKAIESYRHALAIAPSQTDLLNNLGVIYLEQKNYTEAEKHFRQALFLEPNHKLSLLNLGNTLQSLGRFQEAISHYLHIIELEGNSPIVLKNLASANRNLGQLDKVGETLAKISFEEVDQPEIWLERAIYLSQIQEYEQAEKILLVLLEHETLLAETLFQLALIRQHQNRLSEAISLYTKLIEKAPRTHHVWNNLGLILSQQGLISDAIQAFEREIVLHPENRSAQHNRLYNLNLDSTRSVTEVFEDHRQWGYEQLQRVTPRQHWQNPKDPLKKLKIGYVSPDFRSHAVANFLKPILDHHSDSFEIFAYSETRLTDRMTESIKSKVSRWRNTIGISAQDCAKQIEEDGIDILIDLAGHTANNRLDIFALKPAPIQMTYLGYGNTTGLPTIDYLISNSFFHPQDETAPPTVETVIRLPRNLVTYTPSNQSIEVNVLPALKNGYITFGSLHNLNKITPEVIHLWAQVLQKVEKSKLLVFRDTLDHFHQERLLQQFSKYDIPSDRIICRSEIPSEGHLSIYHQIDISLDVFPFGSGTTAYESCWMGVPIITKCGPSMLERGAGSLLYHCELFDFITCTDSGYIETAWEQSQNLQQLAQIRLELRSKMLSSICDASSFTRDLEQLYRDVWAKWCNQ